MIIEEFWKVDPALLLSITEHEYDICKEVIKRGGGQMGKEPHNKARVRAKTKIQAARAAGYSSSSSESDSESSDYESDSESD